jgi:hypothetical protein
MGIIETLVVMLFAGAICNNLKGSGLSKEDYKRIAAIPCKKCGKTKDKHSSWFHQYAAGKSVACVGCYGSYRNPSCKATHGSVYISYP